MNVIFYILFEFMVKIVVKYFNFFYKYLLVTWIKKYVNT